MMVTDNAPARFRKSLIAAGVIVAAMAALSAYAWLVLPGDAMLPVHWSAGGDPDRYAGKWEALATLPAIAFLLSAILAVLPAIEPRRRHLLQSSKAYVRIWLAALGVMAFIHLALVAAALGHSVDMLMIASIGLGALLTVMGNFLTKVHSNFFIGIRTPWTLSSERVWEKTHRLGGRLFFGLGLAFFIVALSGPDRLAFLALIAVAAAISLFVIVYSYVLWRQEQRERIGEQDAGPRSP